MAKTTNRMKTALFFKRAFATGMLVCALAWAGTARAAFHDELQGQDFGTSTWSGGPLNGWAELSNVPCRVHLTGGPVSNQTTIVTFDHLIGGRPAIGNLFSFTPSANVIIVSNTPSLPPGASSWSYTLKYHVTNNVAGDITYFAFISAGAARNGANMAMSGAGVLQIAKLSTSTPGNLDLGVTKSGPTNANAGQIINYVISYTNALSGGDATGVDVSDSMATNLLFVSASDSPQVGGTAVDWILSSVKAGSSGRFTLSAQISASAPVNAIFTNSATIAAAQLDTNSANDSAIVATRVVASCIPPTIAGQPLSVTNCTGASSTFDVIANGTATLLYQWRKDGSDIAGATNDTFTIGSTALSNAATYSVLISNGCGSITSAGAVLTVTAPPTCNITGSSNVCASSSGLVYTNAGSASSPTFSWSITGSGSIVGATTNASVTVTAGTNGTFTLTSTITDGSSGCSDTCNKIVTINSTPSANADSFSTSEDTALSTNVLSNDTDADGDTLTAAVVANPSHGSLSLSSNGSFTYTPTNNFNGSDSFTYRATDACGQSSTGTFNISVSAVNDVPTVQSQTPNVDEDNTLNVAAPGVLTGANDVDGDTLTAMLIAQATNGTTVVNADGSYSYTPDANFHGQDCFTFAATDGVSTSSVATVCVTVNSVNDVPTVQNQTPLVNENSTLNVAAPGVLTGANDADGDPLTAILIAQATNGIAVVNADGSYSYTPNVNFQGQDCFSFAATDGVSTSSVATVCVNVHSSNTAPVANGDSYNAAQDVPLNVSAPGVLGNDTDAELDALSAILVTNVASGTLTLNADGSFLYTPASGATGLVTFVYAATDGGATSGLATVSIDISNVNSPPVATNDSFNVAEDGSLSDNVLTNDTDADGDTLTAALVSNVSNGTLALNADGSFTYTPTNDFNSADSFTYTASDGQTNSNVATVTITVTPVNDAPTVQNQTPSVGEDGTLNVSAPGVLAGANDADGDTLTAILITQATNGTAVVNVDGSYTYTPDANFNGVDCFTYAATDGITTSSFATVCVTVNSVNDAPVANDDSYSILSNTTLNVSAPGVLANDTDADSDSLSAVLVNDVSHGSLALNVDGSFDYTPTTGYVGADNFTYKANDGTADSGSATVNITVTTNGNSTPVASNDNYTVAEDDTLDVDAANGVLANDTDADANSLTATLVSSPAHGALTFNSDGSFGYVPTDNYHGADSFTYKANDGSVDSSVATVSINVSSVSGAGDIDLYAKSLRVSVNSAHAGRDRLSIKGRINPRGANVDLTGAAMQISLNGTNIFNPVALSAKGKAVVTQGGVKIKASFSSLTGLYSFTIRGSNLRDALGLPDTTATGITALHVVLTITGANLDLPVVTGDYATPYRSILGRGTRASFVYRSDRTVSGVFSLMKTTAKQLKSGTFKISSRGAIENEGGTIVTPSGVIPTFIGNTMVTFPGANVKVALSPSARTFKFSVTNLAGTGIPAAGNGAPIIYRLPIMLAVPTGSSTNFFETIIELKRPTGTSMKWKR